MKTFEESKKSQKNVSSMIENKKEEKKKGKGKENKPKGKHGMGRKHRKICRPHCKQEKIKGREKEMKTSQKVRQKIACRSHH